MTELGFGDGGAGEGAAPLSSLLAVEARRTSRKDETALRSLAVASLKRLGYTVLEAGEGVQALELASRYAGTIQVVITDMIMPRMGGLELVGQLRKNRPGIRVIFMSGYTEAATLDRARLEPDAVVLSKPFSIETLASKIRDFHQKPAALVASAG